MGGGGWERSQDESQSPSCTLQTEVGLLGGDRSRLQSEAEPAAQEKALRMWWCGWGCGERVDVGTGAPDTALGPPPLGGRVEKPERKEPSGNKEERRVLV